MASFQVPICALALLVFIQVSARSVYCTGSDDDKSSCLPCGCYLCEPCVNYPGYCNGYYGGCSGCASQKYCGSCGYGCSNGYGDYNYVNGCNPCVCCIVLQIENEKDCCGYSCYGEKNKIYKGDVDGSN